MLRKGLAIAVLFLLPAVASAQVRGPWEVEFSANGQNGNKFNGFIGNLSIDLGYFLNDNLEVGVRQTVGYNDIGTYQFNGSTAVAADFHFPLGDQNQFLPFVGANLGYIYGKPFRDTWELAPEGGIKWFVGPDAFLFAMVQYQFFFTTGSQINNGFQNGQFVYSAGIGFRF